MESETTQSPETPATREPVRYLPEDVGTSPEPGTALCLSGGGFRAMLFHAGVVWRIYEAGKLGGIDRISSVSGGSITAGILAKNWIRLFEGEHSIDRFKSLVVDPLRSLASRTIDIPAVLLGAIWLGTAADRIASAYRKHLYETVTLQDIPDLPRFVFNATNVQSGALWRFSKPYMRDYRVGEIKNPRTELAVVVAASSAFPPVLSPLTLNFKVSDYSAGSTGDLTDERYKTKVRLTDGGVYDNLGLETAWKRYGTILVSDAGAGFATVTDPKTDWVRHSIRVLMTIDNQVRNLRRRQLVESYKAKIRSGSYWSIGHDLAEDFGTPDSLYCPFEQTEILAKTPTRLCRLDDVTQKRLINWGYAICDASVRKFTWKQLAPPTGFPYPDAAVGDPRKES